jgi:hypothetical protein
VSKRCRNATVHACFGSNLSEAHLLNFAPQSGRLDSLIQSLGRFSEKLAIPGAQARGGTVSPLAAPGSRRPNLPTTLAGLLDRQSPDGLAARPALRIFRRAGTNKDLIEEQLFARRRDLFSDLDIVFFDTTSIYFEGEGGETIGRRGHSKDHRPDLKQMVVGIVLDQNGNPICSELWPGNTAGMSSLVPIMERLQSRFGIGSVCIVADRGMISAETLAEVEKRESTYILGVRMRSSTEAKAVVARAAMWCA